MDTQIRVAEVRLRTQRLQQKMKQEGIDALLLASNVNLLYLFGQVYSGVAYVPQQGEAQFFVRRPLGLEEVLDLSIYNIRKLEDISNFIDITSVATIGLELDELSYNDISRQMKLFPNITVVNATQLLRTIRMVKTPFEIEQVRKTAQAHMEVYKQLPKIYQEGMTDLTFQFEIERLMRQMGSTGLFRTFGSSMEIHMGSLLAGNNAQSPSPYDFALGGAGNQTLPLGATGVPLKAGISVMVDMAGNYGPYLSDITRTFSIGNLSDIAYQLHSLSCDMHRLIMQQAKPGVSCAEIYNQSLQMVMDTEASAYFMGTKQQAAFVGHGVGLQINEMPVLTGRSKDVLAEGMVIAYEPKFVLPEIGAVGIENTYLITSDGVENLTPLPEDIIDFLN